MSVLRRLAVLLLVSLMALVSWSCGGASRPDAAPVTDDGTRLLRIPTDGMAPALTRGRTVTVTTNAYERAAPRLGDIVAFHPPLGADVADECGRPRPSAAMCPRPVADPAQVTFVKRIVGLPGDRLRLLRGRVIRNGRRLDEPHARTRCEAVPGDCHFPVQITVPKGHYFMLGDNRGNSTDSRFWGPVKREWLIGRIDVS